MTARTFIARHIAYYWRTHIAVALGAAITTAVLVGARGAGDSVSYSLRRSALQRIGNAMTAIVAGDQFMSATLADRLAITSSMPAAPLLLLRGVAIADGGADRVNNAQIAGVDSRFWQMSLAGDAPASTLCPDEAVVNERLAARLQIKPGDVLVLRIDTPGSLPRDLAFAAGASEQTAVRVTVKAIADRDHFGSFGLAARQVQPHGVFVSREWIAEKLALTNKANVVLCATDSSAHTAWAMEDTGLRLRALTNSASIELFSDRVFMGTAETNAAFAAAHGARGIFTYFVNELRAGTNATPYSFVAAADTPIAPELQDDEIAVNQWLADDLHLATGDMVTLAYYVPGLMRTLVETSESFRVRCIVPMSDAANDLTPTFPGLSDVDNCRDWKPGLPVDLKRIRPKDEAYWNTHRGLPKAFVSLASGQRMWANRFGSLTALRYPVSAASAIASNITALLPPALCGVQTVPLREEALRAATSSVDFGQLFLSLSFFLMLAAVLLTSMLFVFTIEQRAAETGTLRALGFPPAMIRRLYAAEGAVVALCGGALGVAIGITYAQGIVLGLRTVWRGAVGSADIAAYVSPASMAIGLCIGLGAAMAGMWLAIRRQAQRSVRDLLTSGIGMEPAGNARSSTRATWVAATASGVGLGMVAWGLLAGGTTALGAFFGAGALLLLAGIAAANVIIARASRILPPSLAGMALRSCARRRGRSIATVALVACGVFMLVAVAANRRGLEADPWRRSSGTGGFACYGEMALPFTSDLNSPGTRSALHLQSNLFSDVSCVQLRVHDGDDASCLNLARAQQPRLLGVDPSAFARRAAFTFVQCDPSVDSRNPWLALNQAIDADTLPGIADAAVIQWSLGKRVGDTIRCIDDRGRAFNIKLVASLANSVFQGSVLIADHALLDRFPSSGGTRVLLVDAPRERATQVRDSLAFSLQTFGLDLVPAAQRLAEFTAVQNSYLMMFLALGGLGLVLGCIGLGVVVLRNVFERRGELALLQAVGWPRALIVRMLVIEHSFLLGLGLIIGIAAAAVAVTPCVYSPDFTVPYGWLALLCIGVAANGALWLLFSARYAVRGNILAALRTE